MTRPSGKPRSSRIINVAVTQMACTADVAANWDRQIMLIEAAAKRGAKIVCTQELFRTQYFCQAEDYRFFEHAHPIPGPVTRLLGKLARRHRLVIVASLFEKRALGMYHNTAVIIETDGSIGGLYRKMHVPDDPLYYEKFYFTPGDTGCLAHATTYGKIGVLICWDQWFPEAARLCALAGANILFYPTAIGWHPAEKARLGQMQRESWEIIQRSHAIANGLYVCVANRIGLEHVLDPSGQPVNADGIEFWGSSFVAGPDGRVLSRGSPDHEQVITASCDMDEVEFSRTHWPFLRDRRIDAYGDLARRFVDQTNPIGKICS